VEWIELEADDLERCG